MNNDTQPKSPIEFLTVKQVAGQLSIAVPTVYTQIRQGHIPAYRFGHVFRIPKLEFEAWHNSSRVVPDLKP